MLEKIKKIMRVTSTITTATLIVSTFWILIDAKLKGGSFCTVSISVMILPEILLVGFSTGIGTVLILSEETISRREEVIRRAIHFVYICAVVLGLGDWFGWYTPTVAGILLMMLSILVVYLFTFFINYYKSKLLADKLNEKLEQMK